AALVEEATAAARSMEDQANQLAAAVSVFRTTAGNAGAVLPPVARAAPAASAPRAPVPKLAPAPRAVDSTTIADAGDWQEF
ncbi:hypothetical protein ACO0J1_06820, partial [Stenotrophomonas acidaminiphila]